MSHFTVSLILADTSDSTLEGSIEEMLLPYKEAGAGGVPRECLEFRDTEDEYLAEFEGQKVERVRLEDGTTVWPWDERFRVKDGASPFDALTKTVVPEHLERVQQSFSEIYGTFDRFCRDYHAAEREHNGRYGYWHNPKGRWDWYQIGGRWSGLLRTKGGARVDYARFRDLDLRWAADKERHERRTFLGDLKTFCVQGMKDADGSNPFDGVRSTLLDLGLMVCADLGEIPTLEEKYGPIPESRRAVWPRQVTPGIDRFDLIVVDPALVDESWLRKHDGGRFYPFRTYAFLDERGWCEPGKMGWWASTDASPASRIKYGREYRDRFLRALEETPDAFLVVVDCHT